MKEGRGADDVCDLPKKRIPCSLRIVDGLAARVDGAKLWRVGTAGTPPVITCPLRKSLAETPVARRPMPRPNSSARTEVMPRRKRGSRSAIRKLENRSLNRPASGPYAPGWLRKKLWSWNLKKFAKPNRMPKRPYHGKKGSHGPIGNHPIEPNPKPNPKERPKWPAPNPKKDT